MAKYVVTKSADDGNPIWPDEPCFVIRATDKYAVEAVTAYLKIVRDWGVVLPFQRAVDAHLGRIVAWQESHPELVKCPD